MPATQASTGEAEQTLGRSIAHYRLLELLGRGGMGVVYRAVDERSGQSVALKCLAVPKAALLPMLRREIHALTRLRHPGIVRILDSGVHEGLPWYAMELVEGVTLRRPAAMLPTLLTLVRRLCATLSYLHGEGLVHQDLKPDNVMVRADGSPVLVDFGLSVQFSGAVSREALAVEAGGSGTLAYMSPEQLRGETLDARADLYALGCLLYELLTGRPPFVGTAQEVAEGHLMRTPRRPSELAPHLGTQLDELVLRLLAKSPRHRLGHADVVAAELEKLGAAGGSSATGQGPTGKAYLYRPGFAGREEALGTLRQKLKELVDSGQGGLVLVGGESGVGKTRLLMELGHEVTRQGAQMLVGECLDEARQPLEALRKPLQAVADRCRAGGKAETDRLLGRRGKVLDLYEPALAGLPGQEAYPAVGAQDFTPLPAEAARLRLFLDLTETFTAMAAGQPLLLVLDDLQWADELTLGWLESLLRMGDPGRGSMPLLVVGAYRPEEVEAARAAPLRRLMDGRGCTPIALGRLEERAVGAMVGDMLALELVPEVFVRFLSAQSEGNPFFVAEYLRTAAAEGLLARDALGRWQVAGPEGKPAGTSDYEALPLPSSLRDLVSRRLLGLPQEALALCEAAAVLGREADLSLTAQMVHLEEARLDRAMSELLRRQVLETPGPDRVRFVHDKIREVAYERLEAERRSALHREAAEGIEALPAEKQGLRLAALGHHWEEAGGMARACGCYLAAARQAKGRYALGEAERLYRAYLRLIEQPEPESIAARNELAEQVLRFQGRMDEALGELERALQEARAVGDRRNEGVILQSLGGVEANVGKVMEARLRLEEALAIHRQTGDRASEGRGLGALGGLDYGQGKLEEAQALLEEALCISREAGDEAAEARHLRNLSSLQHQQGRFAEAQALSLQALARHRKLGDRWGETVVLVDLGVLYWSLGQVTESIVVMEQALAICRASGFRISQDAILSNLATTRRMQGRLQEAQALYEQALALHREIGNRRFEGLTLANLSVVRAEQGNLEEARVGLEQALSLLRQLDQPEAEALVAGDLAELVRRQGLDFEMAERLAASAEAILARVGTAEEIAEALCRRGHIALAQGRSGRDPLQSLKALATGSETGFQGAIGEVVARFERAVAAFEAGEHGRLFRGELIEDLPEGLRRALIAAGQIPGD